MIRTDCIHYKGEIPCIYHKKFQVECDNQCKYYQKFGRRIIIIKKDALGDVLRTTPILYAIKDHFGDNTHITWVTERNALDLIRFNPLINRIYEFSFKSVLHLDFEDFDVLYNLDKDQPALGLAEKITAKEKYGYTLNKYANLITFNEQGLYAHSLGISDKIKKENTKSYQEIICELLELPYSRDYKYILDFQDKDSKIKELKQKYSIPDKSLIIGFNTGAGFKFPTKKWPKERFIELGKKLIKEKNAYVLIFGSKSEIEDNHYIIEGIRKDLSPKLKINVIDTGAENTILEFALLISLTNIIITGDTLSLHLAIAQSIPSISFFGPTSSSEVDLYDTGIKIIPDSPCLLCYQKECTYSTFCISLITIEEVYEKLLELLKNNEDI